MSDEDLVKQLREHRFSVVDGQDLHLIGVCIDRLEQLRAERDEAREQLKAAKDALQEIVAGDPAGATYSGSQCVEIAAEAICKFS